MINTNFGVAAHKAKALPQPPSVDDRQALMLETLIDAKDWFELSTNAHTRAKDHIGDVLRRIAGLGD